MADGWRTSLIEKKMDGQDDSDRQKVTLQITPAGMTFLDSLYAELSEFYQIIIEKMGVAKIESMIGLIKEFHQLFKNSFPWENDRDICGWLIGGAYPYL